MNPTICPSCGRQTATAVALQRYRYKESGIPNLWLEGGVTETTCSFCKKKHIQINREAQLLQVTALAILEDARPLTGHEMRFLRGAAQMSQSKLAEELRLRRETIAERESKPNPRIAFADEVLFRMVILRGFLARLSDGSNLLTRSQERRLLDFARFFSGFISNYVRELKSTRLVAVMDQGDHWRLDKAA